MAITLDSEENLADMLQYQSFIFSVGLSAWYIYQVKTGHCGWEVIYIAIVESVKYIFELFFETDSPAVVYQTNGQEIVWLRYAEWLSTCPIILIALSRVGTVEGIYSKSTMKLLTSDQGTLVMGVTAAAATDSPKVAFFMLGFLYGMNTFYTAAMVYLEAWKNVPDECKTTVKYMAYIFYSSWVMFPILFVLGPEGAGHLTSDGSTIGHCIADLLSKNLWGVFEWKLDTTLIRLNEEAEEEDEEGEEEGEAETVAKKAPVKAAAVVVDPKVAKVAEPVSSPTSDSLVIIIDPAGMVASFFEMEFGKLGCKSRHVQTPEGAISMLAESQGHGVSFILGPPTCVMHEALMGVKQSQGIPVVVYCDNSTSAEMLSCADDKLELPSMGAPFNSLELSRIIQKFSDRAQPVQRQDTMSRQLFDQMNSMKSQHSQNLGNINMAGGNDMMMRHVMSGQMSPGGSLNAQMSGMMSGQVSPQDSIGAQMSNPLMSGQLSPMNSMNSQMDNAHMGQMLGGNGMMGAGMNGNGINMMQGGGMNMRPTMDSFRTQAAGKFSFV